MRGSKLPSREKVVAVLEEVARRRETISYSRLAAILGLPRRGPHWKALLDDLAINAAPGTPDLTLLVVSATTRLPSQHSLMPDDRKDAAGLARVRAAQEAVWAALAPDGP
ncbi:MAG: hypothetical protein IT534_08100 [Bauldia sp.]|nr:hypothetical protein [Bauldia sp.]